MTDRNLLKRATAECVQIELNRVGDATGCPRLRRESDRDFSFRLALHIQEKIILAEQMLDIVLSLSKHPSSNSTEQSHD